jgi:hypothetical protein
LFGLLSCEDYWGPSWLVKEIVAYEENRTGGLQLEEQKRRHELLLLRHSTGSMGLKLIALNMSASGCFALLSLAIWGPGGYGCHKC